MPNGPSLPRLALLLLFLGLLWFYAPTLGVATGPYRPHVQLRQSFAAIAVLYCPRRRSAVGLCPMADDRPASTLAVERPSAAGRGRSEQLVAGQLSTILPARYLTPGPVTGSRR
jgi:hypothetical protein